MVADAAAGSDFGIVAADFADFGVSGITAVVAGVTAVVAVFGEAGVTAVVAGFGEAGVTVVVAGFGEAGVTAVVADLGEAAVAGLVAGYCNFDDTVAAAGVGEDIPDGNLTGRCTLRMDRICCYWCCCCSHEVFFRAGCTAFSCGPLDPRIFWSRRHARATACSAPRANDRIVFG